MNPSNFVTLRNYLADLYYEPGEIRRIAKDADFPVNALKFDQTINTIWAGIISFALRDHPARLIRLLEVVTAESEVGHGDKYLNGWLENLRQGLVPIDAPPLPTDAWVAPKPSADQLEKLTGTRSTLLPINFLAKGVVCAQAVARVVVSNELGTGFLVANNYFVTNNHVIGSVEKARTAQLEFNFEKTLSDLDANVQTYSFDPDPAGHFVTNVELDYTIVKVKDDLNTRYGALTLSEVATQKDDFVNIIQHPGGRQKSIALYHNVVAFVNESVVQYLTDTEPGSSGSPVLNDAWEVVALHHRGGNILEPGSTQKFIRNEGIAIQNVKLALKALQTS